MKVEEIPDGETLFDKMGTFRPMIVFLDIRLPGEKGLELIPKIKSAYPETLVIVLTAYDLPEYREAAFNGGADGFISKGSLNLSELAIMLNLE